MKYILAGLFAAVIASTFFSCKENDLEKQRENELKKLDEFIRNNYPDLNSTPSGLYYIELEEGIGDSIRVGDQVQYFYEMRTLEGDLLVDGGVYEPKSLVIKPPNQLNSSSAADVNELLGLHEALTYMKKGTKALLILPSQIAFGQYGSPYYGVGGFTTLLLEVEVYKVYPIQTD